MSYSMACWEMIASSIHWLPRGIASGRAREREIVLESLCKQIRFNFQFSETEVRKSMYTSIWLHQLYYLLWYYMCCTVVRCNCDVCFIEINGDQTENVSLCVSLSLPLSLHIIGDWIVIKFSNRTTIILIGFANTHGFL
jgi:hypothetical protein